MEKAPSLYDFHKAIMHMDGDAFFVGVEMAKDPSLRGKPVVTGSERGIVTALSYEAKTLGISRGLPIFQLKKQFPQVKILPGDYAAYAHYSQKMFDIVRRYADDVEEYSIDECFADLTGLDRPLKMSYEEILRGIKKEIWNELAITVSVGLGPTKVLAKVASKWRKPDGLTILSQSSVDAFLKEVSIGAVWGIGPSTTNKLVRLGVQTAYDFAQKEEVWVDHYFTKPHKGLWKELRSTSIFAVNPNAKDMYASISKTRTFFPATNDKTFLLSEISKHAEDACRKARHFNLGAKKISFFLKTKEFRYRRAEITFLDRSNIPEVIIPFIHKNFDSVYQSSILYRSSGVTLHDLAKQRVSQGDLFGNTTKNERLIDVYSQIDKLEERFGKRIVHLASTRASIKKKREGSDFEDDNRHLLFL
jgi:DNA polymerase IV